jgi:hypothetical protein
MTGKLEDNPKFPPIMVTIQKNDAFYRALDTLQLTEPVSAR